MRSGPRCRSVVWLAIVLIVAACGTGDLLGPDAPQGVNGMVLLGPQCPVQTQENPCPDLPFEASITVRRVGGGTVGWTRSGEDGRFSIGLRPGQYVLDPESGDPFPSATPVEVEVTEGTYTDVTIYFDTGIR